MFWDEEKEEETLANNLSQAVDNMADRQFLFRFLLFCGSVNLIVWFCVVAFPETVRDSFILVNEVSDKISKATLAVPFGLGLFFAYSLFRLKFPDIEEQNLANDLMASYHYQSQSLKRWWIWLFSVIAGVLNVLLLIFINIFLSADYKNL